MDCPERGRLLAYLDGEATDAECDHINACPACQAAAADLTAPFEESLGPELCRAAREPSYAPDEVERAVAIVNALGALAGPGDPRTVPRPPAPSTLTMGDPSPADTAPPPGQATGPGRLPFLALPRGPGELGWLDEYRVLEVLGEGGMGMVLRARDETLGRDVALKVMRDGAAASPQARQRFLREARAMAAVEHRRVVPVWHVGECGGVPYLAMPLLKGESLAARLQRGPRLGLAEAVRIGREAAEGLAAAHRHGLIHRDVKPSNLWLREDEGGWGVVLLDFGLARPQQSDPDLTRPGAVLGTPRYMAPEQAAGQEVDPRCDLFSLGVVLYQLLTGVSPFAAADDLAVLSRLATHQPAPPRQLDAAVPAALSDLVMRLLAKDRDGRPATARAVAAALGELERGLPSGEPTTSVASVDTAPLEPTTGARPPAPPGPGRRWFLLGSGAVLLAGVVGLAVLLPRWLTPVPATVIPPLKGAIDVLVYEPDNPRRQNLFLDDPGAMPLRPGDEFYIEAELNRPAYLYVLWIDTDGKVLPVYPWRPGHWEDRHAQERPVARLRRPEALDEFYKVPKGTPGMETLVLLARETPLPPDIDLRAELGELPRPAAQELKATAWFENGAPVRNRRGREGRFDVTRRQDPVLGTQQRIRERLTDHFAYVLAVSFANQGK
jgi:serine/threonine protein kinase